MRSEIRNSRKSNLISAAEDVFFEKGYTKTSISDVCKKFGCSRTTLYKYFENKENLYLAVVNKSFKLFLENFINLQLTGNNGMEKVLAYAQGYINFYKKFPKNYLMILDFYTVLNSLNNKSFQSDAHVILSKCSLFPNVKTQAELPFTHLVKTIKEGQEDESINSDISAEVLFLNLWAYLIGSSHLFDFSDAEQNIHLFNVQMDTTEKRIFLFIRKLLT